MRILRRKQQLSAGPPIDRENTDYQWTDPPGPWNSYQYSGFVRSLMVRGVLYPGLRLEAIEEPGVEDSVVLRIEWDDDRGWDVWVAWSGDTSRLTNYDGEDIVFLPACEPLGGSW